MQDPSTDRPRSPVAQTSSSQMTPADHTIAALEAEVPALARAASAAAHKRAVAEGRDVLAVVGDEVVVVTVQGRGVAVKPLPPRTRVGVGARRALR